MTALVLVLVCSAIVSYLMGGLNGAIMLSRAVYHQDIRELGSKNPGFTNFKRVYGNGIVSWLVIVIDMLKTVLPVLGTALVMSNVLHIEHFGWQFGAQFSGLFCMIGHCFPVWYKFKGGKAFITGFATIWFVDWRMALAAMAVFFIVLFIGKYMSVASCSAAFFCPIALASLSPESIWVELMAIAAALLVILRHWPNFVKLAHGTESKFSLRGKKKSDGEEKPAEQKDKKAQPAKTKTDAKPKAKTEKKSSASKARHSK